jgi:hypothetical protein
MKNEDKIEELLEETENKIIDKLLRGENKDGSISRT